MHKVTEFQKRVYKETAKIPKGQTRSYGYIAKKLNTSPRAVGQALKRNPFAPRIPCHRVIKSDGTIGGFNGQTKGKEIQRKIQLLKKEGFEINEIGSALNERDELRNKILTPDQIYSVIGSYVAPTNEKEVREVLRKLTGQ